MGPAGRTTAWSLTGEAVLTTYLLSTFMVDFLWGLTAWDTKVVTLVATPIRGMRVALQGQCGHLPDL